MLPLCILVLLCHSTDALWVSTLGSEAVKCVGDNITFDWAYVTDQDEPVLALFWVSKEKGTIASYYLNMFSSQPSRLHADPSGWLTLNDLSTEDTGNYTVTALGLDSLYDEAETVQLIVLEPPQTVTGHLEIFETDSKLSSDVNSQLKCGRFISLGTPPVSVVWKDPDGYEMPSTGYTDGYFVLDLPAESKERNYSCSVDRKSSSAQCLASDSPLLRDAVIVVDRSLADTAKELMDLKKQMEELKAELASFDRDDMKFILSQTADADNQTGKGGGSAHGDSFLKEIADDMNETISRQDIIIKQQEAVMHSLVQNFTRFQTDFLHHYNTTTKLLEKFTDSDTRQRKVSQDLEERIRELEISQVQLITANASLRGQVDRLGERDSQLEEAYAQLFSAVNQQQNTHNNSIIGSEVRIREELKILEKSQQESHQEFLSEMQDLRRNLSDLRSAVDLEVVFLRRDFQTQLKAKVDSVWEEVGRNFTAIDNSLQDVRRSQVREVQSLRSDLEGFRFQCSNWTATIQQRTDENLEEMLGKLQDNSDKHLDLEADLHRLEELQEEIKRNTTNDLKNLMDQFLELSARLESGQEQCSLMETRLQDQLLLLNATLGRQLEDKGQTINLTLWKLVRDVSVLQSQQLADKATLANLTTATQKQINSLQMLFDLKTDQLFRNLTSSTRQQVVEVRSPLDSRLNALSSRLDTGDRKYSELDSKVRYVETALKRFNPVRLVGGSTAREGRVELLMGSSWGTVCDDSWDDVDAGVVCVSLGFSRLGARATTQASFGQGSGLIVLDDVACNGTELDLRFCNAPSLGTHNCGHTEDAGVVCQP